MTEPPKIEITTEAYSLWLQAGRPDLMWFMALSPAEQDHFGTLGNIDTIERILATARAMRNPEAFEAAHYGTETQVEEVQVEQLAMAAISRLLGGSPESAPAAAAPDTSRSMAGALQAQQDADTEAKDAKGTSRRFLGRVPDQFRGETG